MGHNTIPFSLSLDEEQIHKRNYKQINKIERDTEKEREKNEGKAIQTTEIYVHKEREREREIDSIGEIHAVITSTTNYTR